MGITSEWSNLEKIMDSFQGRHASGARFAWGAGGSGTYANSMFITLDLSKISNMLKRAAPLKAAPPYLTDFLWLTKMYIQNEIPKKAFENKGINGAAWRGLSPRTIKHREWLQKIGYNKHGASEPLLRNSDELFMGVAQGHLPENQDNAYLTAGGKYVRAFIEVSDTKMVTNEPRHGTMRYEKLKDRFIRHMFGTGSMPERPMMPRNNSELDSEDYAQIRKQFRKALENNLSEKSLAKAKKALGRGR